MSSISSLPAQTSSSAFAHAAVNTATSTAPTSTGAASGTDALATTQTFLQLMVAELKNQDPSAPVQGTEYITQLAQFSNLEQSVSIRDDIQAIRNKFAGDVTPTTPSASGN